MPTSNYSINHNAVLQGVATTVSVGQALLKSSTGYVVATSANRTTYSRRADGIALTASSSGGAVQIAHEGLVDSSVTGLGAGTASWVRVSATGTLERVTPGSGDDIVGKCTVDGDLHLECNKWDSNNYLGSFTAGGDLTGTSSSQTVAKVNGTTITTAGGALAVGAVLRTTAAGVADWGTVALADTDAVSGTLPLTNGGFGANVSAQAGIPVVAAGTFGFVTAPTGTIVGHNDSQTLTNKTIAGASNTLTVRLGSDVSGTLPHANGGLAADVSGYSGLVKITGGASSAVAAPSGAVVGTTDTQTLSGKTYRSVTTAMGALEINWASGNVFTKTLAAGGNTLTFANDTDGQTITIVLTSNGGGSTVTWPAGVLWTGGTEPTQTSTGVDVYTLVKAGSAIYGSYVQAFS